MKTALATIALGANLDSPVGPPAATLAAAIVELRTLGALHAASSIWLTPPVGYTDQPWFHNAVVQIRTTLPPESLLENLLCIERDFARNRAASPNAPGAIPNGPRTLDLDLLLVDDCILTTPDLTTPDLTLPHPRFHQRAFVLLPLAEIAPTLLHPLTRRTIADHLAALPSIDRTTCTRLAHSLVV